MVFFLVNVYKKYIHPLSMRDRDYVHECLIFMVNQLGKYTSHIHSMGHTLLKLNENSELVPGPKVGKSSWSSSHHVSSRRAVYILGNKSKWQTIFPNCWRVEMNNGLNILPSGPSYLRLKVRIGKKYVTYSVAF